MTYKIPKGRYKVIQTKYKVEKKEGKYLVEADNHPIKAFDNYEEAEKYALKKKEIATDVAIHLQEKEGSKLPFPTPIKQYKEEIRLVYKYPKKLYTEGNFVSYKTRLAKVNKVTSKGVFLQLYKDPDKAGVFDKEKEIFLTHNEYEKTTEPEWSAVFF
jgi:hypothetical protein